LPSGDFGMSPVLGGSRVSKAFDHGSHTMMILVWCLLRRMSL